MSFVFCHFRERSWCGVYTSEELSYAVSIGYHILDVFELHQYDSQDFVLRDYIKTLAYFKLKVSMTCSTYIAKGIEICGSPRRCFFPPFGGALKNFRLRVDRLSGPECG